MLWLVDDTILQLHRIDALDSVDTRSRYKSCGPGDQRPSVRGDMVLHHPVLWTPAPQPATIHVEIFISPPTIDNARTIQQPTPHFTNN